MTVVNKRLSIDLKDELKLLEVVFAYTYIYICHITRLSKQMQSESS